MDSYPLDKNSTDQIKNFDEVFHQNLRSFFQAEDLTNVMFTYTENNTIDKEFMLCQKKYIDAVKITFKQVLAGHPQGMTGDPKVLQLANQAETILQLWDKNK